MLPTRKRFKILKRRAYRSVLIVLLELKENSTFFQQYRRYSRQFSHQSKVDGLIVFLFAQKRPNMLTFPIENLVCKSSKTFFFSFLLIYSSAFGLLGFLFVFLVPTLHLHSSQKKNLFNRTGIDMGRVKTAVNLV